MPRAHPTAAATHSFLCPFPTSLPFNRAPNPTAPRPHCTAHIQPSLPSFSSASAANNRQTQAITCQSHSPPRVHPRINSSSYFYCHFISRDAEGQRLHLLLKVPSLLQALPRSQQPRVGWKTPGPAAGTKPRCAPGCPGGACPWMQAGASCPGFSQMMVQEAAELQKCLNAVRATQR